MIPNVTLCPVPNANTKAWLDVSAKASLTLTNSSPGCNVSVISLDTLGGQVLTAPPLGIQIDPGPKGGGNRNGNGNGTAGVEVEVDVTTVLPAGSLWQLFGAQLASQDATMALAEYQLHDCDHGQPIGGPLDPTVVAFSDALQSAVAATKAAAGSALWVRVSSKSILFQATQAGVDQTMNLSAMTLYAS